MKIQSPAFQNNELIPAKYTCTGENIAPDLSFSEIPEETKSLALIVDDPDAPSGDFVHWLVWNIDPSGDISSGVQGKNDFGENKYGGPCPPSGVHRYFFKLFALDSTLDIPTSSTKADLLSAIEGHILAQSKLIGKFSK